MITQKNRFEDKNDKLKSSFHQQSIYRVFVVKLFLKKGLSIIVL